MFSATLLWRAFRDGKHGDLAATFGFFLLVCRLQGLHVALPLTRPRRSADDEVADRFQANYSIDISYLSYAPILFQAMLLSCTYVFSEVSTLHDSYFYQCSPHVLWPDE